MPDDERSRRRLGDATKSRIADLASGWSVDAPSTEPPALDTDPVPRVTPSPDDAPLAAIPASESGSSLLPPPPTPQPPPPVAPLPAPPPAVPPPPKPGTIPPPVAAPREKKPTAPPGYAKIQAPVRAAPAPAPEPPASGPTRSKPKTNPPPPPGSPERKALEEKIVATKVRDDVTDVMPPRPDALPALGRTGKPPTTPPPPPRAKPPTAPPPPPGSPRRTGANPIIDSGRTKTPTAPPPPPSERSKPVSYPPSSERAKSPSVPPAPPGPKFPRAGYEGAPSPLATSSTNDSDAKPFATEAHTPAVIIEAGAFAGNAPPPASGELSAKPPRPVPLGEFGEGADTKQITAKRDAAEAILKIPDEETPVEDLEDEPRAKPDPQTKPFERGDPTQNAPPDATEIQSPTRVKQLTGGTLRRHAALRRKRGLYGDVRYVFTAVFGVRNARGELAALEHRQEVRATSRKRHLITLGRAAATMDNFDHPALGRARDTLALIEDERAKHAGAVAASDAELERVRRDRETNRVAHVEAIAKTDAELAELAKKLEPLEKEALAARKKSSELREEVHRIDKKIADTEALLVSVKGEKLDKAGVQADIATYKANKQAVLRDEPVIAAELDALNPRIAALEATRSELQKKKVELDKNDQEDQRRTLELLEAIGAKRKVVERASADAETARDNALFELGERLYVDRPSQLSPQLSPIDRIDLEIGEDERRAMELKEILSNIDKAKLARGLAMIILALGAAITLTWLIVSMAS